jgi:PAS domain S-box-containing protein
LKSLDRIDNQLTDQTASNLSALVIKEWAANEKATAKALDAQSAKSELLPHLSAEPIAGGDKEGDLGQWRKRLKGPVADQNGEGKESDALAWGELPADKKSYRFLTSIELVTAICVAAVGLSRLRANKAPIPEAKQDLKSENLPDDLESEASKAEKEIRAKAEMLDEQSEWADLERGLKDSAWISENVKRKPLAKVKSEVVVCSFDRNLNFTSFSDAVLPRWGYQPQELIGHSIIGLVRTEDLNGTLEALRELVANKTGLAFENWIRHKSGNWMAISWSAYWSDADDRVVAIARDVTAEKELEQRRQEAVQMVSHDLRSPLTSIQFSLELLAQGASGALSDEALEDVRIAQNNTTQLINLVNDLLDLEKIEHGVLRMNLERTELTEIVQAAIDNLRFLARSRRIEIEFTVNDLVVFADKDRIVQVIVNMLSNAIKFSPEGSSITVDCQIRDALAEIRVVDQGPGIPAQYQEAIFERFKQIEGRQGVGQKGAGLGLAICKSIIDGHKGQIGVQSSHGTGSTFWFRIPLFEKRAANRPFGKVARHLGFRAQASS